MTIQSAKLAALDNVTPSLHEGEVPNKSKNTNGHTQDSGQQTIQDVSSESSPEGSIINIYAPITTKEDRPNNHQSKKIVSPDHIDTGTATDAKEETGVNGIPDPLKPVLSKIGEYEEIKVTTSSSEITIRSKRQQVPVSLPPALPAPGGSDPILDTSNDFDPENWADLIQYQKTDNHGATTTVNESEFYEKQRDKPGDFYPLCLSRDIFGDIEIHILSQYLRRLLQNYVSTQEIEGVKVKSTTIVVKSPFVPLFHFLEDMKTAVELDTEASPKDRVSFVALEKLCETRLVVSAWETAKASIELGQVAYSDLWALYKPDEKVVVRASGKDEQLSVMLMTSVRNQQEQHNRFEPFVQRSWEITTLNTSWDGLRFRETYQMQTIPTFLGRKSIKELKVIPLRLHPDRENIERDSQACGKIWKDLCHGEPRTMMYEGLATPLLIRKSYGGGASKPEEQAISSRVILDPKAWFKAATSANFLFLEFYTEDESGAFGRILRFRQESGKPPDLSMCPPRVPVFSFEEQKWFIVNVLQLKEVNWDSKIIDRVELPMEQKRLLHGLARAHSTRGMPRSDDIIKGKGKGLVFLFHGPSGVGKTLTAESLSELTHKPLYRVNLGVVSDTPYWEAQLDHIFYCAHSWDAILLIDEADVVLEERSVAGRQQNTWASVFLRKLEYYQGILILTTNLVNTIDEAFRSRITIAIEFKELSYTTRLKIWTTFINGVDRSFIDHQKILAEVPDWANEPLNARQIRNIVLTAESLAIAKGEGGKIEPDDVQIVLKHTIKTELNKLGNLSKSESFKGGW